MTKAEKIYMQMTSYSNPKEMNGISKEWMVKCIEEGVRQAYKDGFNNAIDSKATIHNFVDSESYILNQIT